MATAKTNGSEDKEKELEPVGPNVDDDSHLESEDNESDTVNVGDSNEDDEDEKPAKKKQKETEDDDAGHQENKADDEEEEDGEGEKPRKKSRKQRQREARNRDKRELNFLRIRNEQLESRFGAVEARTIQNEAVAIDNRISHITEQLRIADQVIAEAVTKGEGKEMLEAQKIKGDLEQSLGRLRQAKANVERAIETVEAGGSVTPQPKVPAAVVANARTWLQNNSWYDPTKPDRDKDSRTVKRLDTAVMNEGYDPKTEEYWEELTKRVQKALPHRFDDDEDDDDASHDEDEDDDEDERPVRRDKTNGKKPRGPTFTTRGREVPLKPNQVYISPARKAAMIEAGVWDDPKERQRYLKSFAKYDRDHPRTST
jgi:hypothetical protein